MYLFYIIFWLKLFIHRNFEKKKILNFFITKLQPYFLKVSSKKKNYQCNLDYKHLFIKINQKTLYKPYKAIMYR